VTSRAAPIALEASPAAATDVRAVRRVALWVLLGAKVVAGWGVRWDIQWHVQIGRDSFWIAPHVMTYAGVAATVLVSFGVLVWETARGRERGALTLLGLTGTRGFHVAAWGIAITVLAAPIDDLWHRLFGLDITLWSPPHLLGFLGAGVNSIGCLLIAREVYPEGSRARLAALVLAGATLYGTLHPTLEPAVLTAYRHGGLRFFTYAMLAALILPLALVPTARLAGQRWAPALALGVVVLANLAGDQIARAGFAWLQPVPAIEEAIARDPTSPIALANEIARKNAGPAGASRLAARPLALLPALLMVLVDVRRRPVTAALAYAAGVFALSGWSLAGTAAFHPLVPSAPVTGLAFGLTLAAGAAGGWAAARFAEHLARRA
jgi:hypothetical protein